MITKDGVKMSKSLGNVVDPYTVKDVYGVDALRFYLCREIPTGDDGDFDMERFDVVYNTELGNKFGNCMSRVVAMNHKYFDGEVFVQESFATFNLKKVCELIIEFCSELNTYVEEQAPWALAKAEEMQKLKVVMYNLLEGLRIANRMLSPFMPGVCARGLDVLNLDNFDSKFVTGHKLGEKQILFPRIDK
jgi:methionyl-tRNA synthetase